MAWQYWSGNKKEPLFFDIFSGGLGGVSYRKLVSSYSGRWGRAINTTTLEERDIFFDGTGLIADVGDIIDLSNGTDTVELMNYDNSFVKLYIGMSELQRPALVNSGTLVTLNGNPAFGFDRVLQRIVMSLSDVAAVDPTPISLYSLGKINILRQRNLSVATLTGNYGYFHGGTLVGYDGMGVHDPLLNVASLADEDLNRRLGTYHWDATTIKIASNGSALTSFAGLNGAFAVRNIGVGQGASAQYFSGIIQEVLLFDTNKEADDSDIRTNINDRYSAW